MKLTRIQNVALTAGFALMGVGMLVGTLQDLSVPSTRDATRECESPQDCVRTVEFGRAGPCATCGKAAPVLITREDGTVWRITGPGTVEELGQKYCDPYSCTIAPEISP